MQETETRHSKVVTLYRSHLLYAVQVSWGQGWGHLGHWDTGECTLTGPQSCSFGDLQVFSLTPYELNVTARNPLGAASGALPFLLENIIKPDPPEALRVSPIPGEPQKLLLEWNPPSSWPFPEYFPLHYCIRYSWDNDSVPTTVGPYELTSHTLTDLEPGSLHHIQVAQLLLSLHPWNVPGQAGPGLESPGVGEGAMAEVAPDGI
uniref:Fibronectin type-III domain-containing protein n=1 Tax=Zonotrichia albicollis TaxID=44394 RepID=A0A8D2MLQ6_ZONAL